PASRARARRAAAAALDVDQVRGAMARVHMVEPRCRRRVEHGAAPPRARDGRPGRARAHPGRRRALQRRRRRGDAGGVELARAPDRFVSSFPVLLLLAFVAPARSRADLTPQLGFERIDSASVLKVPMLVPGYPPGTVFLDSTTVHSGRHSARFERTATSASTFSNLGWVLPIDFAGQAVELRGWLRRENVVGFAGLWLREDGDAGVVQFDNMEGRRLNGTADWTEYRVTLPLDVNARQLVFGSLLVGTGRVWADDLGLFVDGKPLAGVPVKPRELTVLDRDTSFSAGSGITLGRPSPVQVENLVLLGKVWGFLKYHHPAVVRGDRHWDFDLFRVTPGVLAAKNATAAQHVISAWVDSLGPVPACSSCVKLPEGRALAPRLGWLDDRAKLGQRLRAQLVQVYARRRDVWRQ